MTRETYKKAHRLVHDLTILKDIKFEHDKNHCVGFCTPGNEIIDSFLASELQDDFREFIIRETEKVNKMLEEL